MPKILIIDDDDLFRGMLIDMLSADGYEILEASDGNTGLRVFKEKSPDLVITDILMPEKEGMQTIREIRQAAPHVKIIALSGGGTHPTGLDYLQMAQDLGADRSFPKPFRTSEFVATVAEMTQT